MSVDTERGGIITFTIGVPVTAQRILAGNEHKFFDSMLARFLIMCASSTTTRPKSSWYIVIVIGEWRKFKHVNETITILDGPS
jgi:hypothetical protein